MKEFVSQVSFLKHNFAADQLTKKSLLTKPRFFNRSPHDRSTFVDSEGIELHHSTPHLYGIRSLFESLKQEKFIRHYGEGPIFSDYPKFHYLGVNYIIDAERLDETQLSWGYCLPGDDVEVAFSKALGESLERQASYYHPALAGDRRFPKLKSGDASFLFSHIPQFSPEQIEAITDVPIARSSEDLKHCLGFTARSLTGDRKRFLPFECFYWGTPAAATQKLLFHPTSSGSGGGCTREQAIVSGWYEAIERDHLLLYWLSGAQPDQIDTETIPGPLGDYVRSCEKQYGLEVYFLNLHYDIDVLTAACVVIDPVLNIVTMGAKTGISASAVLQSCLLEALAVLASTRSRNEHLPETRLAEILSHPPFTLHISRKDRVNLYNSPAGIELIRNAFLRGRIQSFDSFNTKPVVDNSINMQYEHLATSFKKLIAHSGSGYHAYVHEFDSPWLKALSYHAAHVFIPSLLKLHLNETLATPRSERLNQFIAEKQKAGYSLPEKMNPLPHFFP